MCTSDILTTVGAALSNTLPNSSAKALRTVLNKKKVKFAVREGFITSAGGFTPSVTVIIAQKGV